MSEYLSQWEAAELLCELLGQSTKYWYGFLYRNSRATGVYKITWHIQNGRLHYTEAALLEYVRVNLSLIANEVTM